MVARALVPLADDDMPATLVSGERLKSRTFAESPGCTYDAAIVSMLSGSRGGQKTEGPEALNAWCARRSMHQGCLLKGRNSVLFAHFPPFFAHFQRLDARNPESTARSPGGNGKKSRKIVENGGN